VSVAAALLAFVAAALAAGGLCMLALDAGAPRQRAGRPRLLRTLVAAGRGLAGSSRPAPVDLRGRIAAAGHPAGLGAREVMAAKLAAAVGCGAAGVVLSGVAPGRLGLVLAPAAPVAGFLAPDLWLARLAGERARRARRELPAMLDLLRVAVEAGDSLSAALRTVGERADGVLASEWRAAGRQAALGVPLEAALASMGERLPLPEMRALTGAIERARRHGSPLAETLAAQSRDARFALARRVREEAARAGPKIQLVVALLLVPSVMLLLAAALAAALLESGSGLLPV
jgi:tight adherence protein C